MFPIQPIFLIQPRAISQGREGCSLHSPAKVPTIPSYDTKVVPIGAKSSWPNHLLDTGVSKPVEYAEPWLRALAVRRILLGIG